MKKFVISLLLIGIAGIATAETTVCSAHGMKRVITVATGDKGCQVNYTKDGKTKTLWYASKAHMDYCKTHAADFIKKQEGWGFTCTPEAEPAPAAAK